jgi:Flp pilus assembly pilin Flp
MKNILTTLWNNENAQDLIEYSLLLAFVTKASAASVSADGGGVQGILSIKTNNLDAANQMAS